VNDELKNGGQIFLLMAFFELQLAAIKEPKKKMNGFSAKRPSFTG
jgi:hypothetical protein